MQPNYKWEIKKLVTDQTEKKVVIVAEWSCTAEKDDVSIVRLGTQVLGQPKDDSFVQYDALTESVVIAWVKEAIGDARLSALYAGFDREFESRFKPAAQENKLPWEEVKNA